MNSNPLRYELIDHASDLGIVVRGIVLQGVFIRTAHAMTDLMVKADIREKGAKRKPLAEGHDLLDLMVRWLSEIFYLFNGERMLVSAIEISSIGQIQLQSNLSKVPSKKGHHEILRRIKAVT